MKRKWIPLAIPVLLLLAGLGWYAVLQARRTALQDSLVRAVRMYNIGYASQIEVRAFTDFDWELLYVFGPYTTGESVNREIGFDWPGARFLSSRLKNDERVCLLVFVEEGKVVGSVEIERAAADFAGLAAASPYTTEAARFFILPGSETELGLMEAP